MKDSANPYWNEAYYAQSLETTPEVVIFMLGTNDAWQWRDPGTDYDSDWKAMVQSFQGLASKPKVFVMIPPPVYKDGQFGMRGNVINDYFLKRCVFVCWFWLQHILYSVHVQRLPPSPLPQSSPS